MQATSTRTIVAAAAICGALLAPAVASADSIVYADGGNIWTSRPDGTGKLQLTTGGSWHSPTQADDGTIAAVQGTGPIVVMAKDGRPIRTITTAQAKSGDGGTFAARPVQLSFSPDGSKIAYAYVASSCPPASSCGTIQTSTFYTRADVTEATPISQWGNQFSVSDPEWVTNDRVLVFGGAGSQVSIDDLGPGDYSQRAWMTPPNDQGDGELSRDGKRLVTTWEYGDHKLIVWFVTSGDPRTDPGKPATPKAACTTGEGDALVGDPSFSPDGTGTAFNSKDGIQVAYIDEMREDYCAVRGKVAVLSATGSDPDWGPADPATAVYRAPVDTTQNTGGGKGVDTGRSGGSTAGDQASPIVTVSAGGKPSQKFKRSVSVTCAASVAGNCVATATVKIGKKTYIATASGTVAVGKPKTLTPAFTKKDAAAITKALKAKKKVTAAVALNSGNGSASRAITLKR